MDEHSLNDDYVLIEDTTVATAATAAAPSPTPVSSAPAATPLREAFALHAWTTLSLLAKEKGLFGPEAFGENGFLRRDTEHLAALYADLVGLQGLMLRTLNG